MRYDDATTPAANLCALWQAVLSRALLDALSLHGEHRAWVRFQNPDFTEVCILADRDPAAVMRTFLAAERRHTS